jgi:uncharacterized membrane protein
MQNSVVQFLSERTPPTGLQLSNVILPLGVVVAFIILFVLAKAIFKKEPKKLDSQEGLNSRLLFLKNEFEQGNITQQEYEHEKQKIVSRL